MAHHDCYPYQEEEALGTGHLRIEHHHVGRREEESRIERESTRMAFQSFPPGAMRAACSISSADLSRELVDDRLQHHPETEASPQTGRAFPFHAAAGSGRYGGEREMHSYLLVLQAGVHLDWEQSDARMSTYPHLWPGPVKTVTLHVHPDPPWAVVFVVVVGMH